jgi:hypothetical protein
MLTRALDILLDKDEHYGADRHGNKFCVYSENAKKHLRVTLTEKTDYDVRSITFMSEGAEAKAWMRLAQLLLLASWKVDYETVNEFAKTFFAFLSPDAKAVYDYTIVDMVDRFLDVMRRELEEAASIFALLIYSTTIAENELDMKMAVHRFLAYHGTQLAHVFQVGTGRFPPVEKFFANLQMFYDHLCNKRPVPYRPDLNVSAKGLNSVTDEVRPCAICDLDIAAGVKLFGIEYTYSKNDAFYPRVIYGTEGPEDSLHLVCKHECMVKHLESLYPELHKCLAEMIKDGWIPEKYYEHINTFESMDFDKETVLLYLRDLMDQEKKLCFFVSNTFQREYDAYDKCLLIDTPDVSDPRMPNLDRYKTGNHKFVEGWSYGNPEIAAKVFGLSYETIFYKAKTNTKLTPRLIGYRKELADAVAEASKEVFYGDEKESVYIWQHRWGSMYDSLECGINLSLVPSEHLSRFQPFTNEKAMLRYMKRCGLTQGDKELLIYPVRNNMFGLAEYRSGYKFLVQATDDKHREALTSMLTKVDCLLFARNFNFHTQFCFGGFMFLQDGQLVAVVLPNMFDYLTAHFSPSEFANFFNDYAKHDFKLTKCKELKPESTSDLISKADFKGRKVISFFLCLVLQRMSHEEEAEEAEDNLEAPEINLVTIKKSVTIKNWIQEDCKLVKIIEVSDRKSKAALEMLESVEQEALNKYSDVTAECKMYSDCEDKENKNFMANSQISEEMKWEVRANKGLSKDYSLVGSVATKHNLVTYRGAYWCRLILHNVAWSCKMMYFHVIPRDCNIFEKFLDHFHDLADHFSLHPDKVFRFKLKKDNGQVEEVTIPCTGVSPQSLAFEYGVSPDRLELALTEPMMTVQQKRNVFAQLPPLEYFTLDRTALLPR